MPALQIGVQTFELQERIGTDIAEIMQEITGSDDVAVLIEAVIAA